MDPASPSGGTRTDDAVPLSDAELGAFERFSLFNSPYTAHDRGRAVDLYPAGATAPSPVAGEVLATRTVRCPPAPHAESTDHLILVDRGDDVARILHVDPDVVPGEAVGVGDPLGTLVRSGFFSRWVDDHVHLGFRCHGQDIHRASGSLPLELDVDVAAVTWDGTGTVVETGPTHVRLDAPGGGDGGRFRALASDGGVPLDGGLVHYEGGGCLDGPLEVGAELSLLGTTVGTVVGDGGSAVAVRWHDVATHADGLRATGLSLFTTRRPVGVKLVFQGGHPFDVGDDVEVTVEPSSEQVRLE